MDKFLRAFCCSWLLTGCQEHPLPKEEKLAPPTALPVSPALKAHQVAKHAAEYLLVQGPALNGKSELVSKTTTIFRLLGQPDSLITTDDYCAPFYDKPFKVAYCKESVVEVYGDTAVVSTIDFRHNPKLELQTGTITLSHRTTLAEVAKHFPNAVKNRQSIDYFRKGKRQVVSLNTGAVPSDYSWLLFFAGEHLESLELHTSC